jgi:hypothetical protein
MRLDGSADLREPFSGKPLRGKPREWIRRPLKSPRHEAFAQALARGMSAAAVYVEGGCKASTTDALG